MPEFRGSIEPKLAGSLQEPDFSGAWNNPIEIYSPSGESFQLYDIQPPEIREASLPVVLLPGFGGTPQLFRHAIDTIARDHRRVISIDAPHGVQNSLAGKDTEQFHEATLKKVSALMQALEAMNIEKVDAVGNSEGAMIIVIAAHLHPEKFRNIVLESPAGMVGKDDLPRLATGFMQDIISSDRKSKKENKTEPQTNPQPQPDLSVRNIRESVKDAWALVDTQIKPLLADLRSKHGIGISIIHRVDDQAFPMKRVQANFTRGEGTVDGFYATKGSHAYPQNSKDLQPHDKLIVQALTALEKKSVNKL